MKLNPTYWVARLIVFIDRYYNEVPVRELQRDVL